MKWLALVLALALAGCATPKERIVYKEVRVPVSVPCKVKEPVQPAYAADDVSLGAPLFELVRSLLVEREQRKAEAIELRAVKSCQP